MKSKILPLVFAAVMMVSMTACGTTNNADNPNAGQGSGSTSAGDNSAGGGTDDSLNNGAAGNEDGTGGGILGNEDNGSQSGALDNNGTVSGADGNAAGSAGSASGAAARRDGQPIVRSATYEQMLRNARVHDTDGDLTDGENAVTPGIKY